jgi:hypothetical protein
MALTMSANQGRFTGSNSHWHCIINLYLMGHVNQPIYNPQSWSIIISLIPRPSYITHAFPLEICRMDMDQTIVIATMT